MAKNKNKKQAQEVEFAAETAVPNKQQGQQAAQNQNANKQ